MLGVLGFEVEYFGFGVEFEEGKLCFGFQELREVMLQKIEEESEVED